MGVPISNVTRRVVYAASGTGPYNFTFEILANTDVAVYRDDTLLTLTSDYTVTINANGTGYITLTAAPTGATQIAIVGNRTIQRMTDFVTGGDFFANTVNDEMDQQTIFAQQNAEGLQRALQAPQTDPTNIDMTMPRKADRANKYLAFNADGNPVASSGTGTSVVSTAMEPVVSSASLAAGRTAFGLGSLAEKNEIDNDSVITSKILNQAVTPAKLSAGAPSWDVNGNLLAAGSIREKQTTVAASDINLNSGNFFNRTISTTTTFTVSNVPPSGTAVSFILDITNGGAATVNWWSGVKWAYGAAPTLTVSGRDVLGFYTYDGGTTWTGLVLGKDVK